MKLNSYKLRYASIALFVFCVGGFVLFNGLNSATMYYKTVDEALAQRSSLEGKRFRMEGIVEANSVHADGTLTDFVLASKGTRVEVRNAGQPLGVFREGIPVVVEGRFAKNSNSFNSDRIMVKHSEDYQAKHPQRVDGSANK